MLWKKYFKKMMLLGLTSMFILGTMVGCGSDKNDVDSYGTSTDSEAKEDKKSFSLFNKDGFVKSYKDLKKDENEKLLSECYDFLASQDAFDESRDVTIVSDAEYAGYIFGTRHAEDSKDITGNHVTIVFKETINEYGYDQQYYKTVSLDNLERKDGSIDFNKDPFLEFHDYTNPLDAYLRSMELANIPDMDSFEYGGMFEQYEDCEPLDSLSNMSDDSRKAFIDDASAYLEVVGERMGYSDFHISDITYVGDIFALAKDGTNLFGNHNHYCPVFTATISDSVLEPTMVYLPVEYLDLYKLKNGECQHRASMGNIYGDFYNLALGFTTDEDMYREVIAQDRVTYNFELSDSLQYLEDKYKKY